MASSRANIALETDARTRSRRASLTPGRRNVNFLPFTLTAVFTKTARASKQRSATELRARIQNGVPDDAQQTNQVFTCVAFYTLSFHRRCAELLLGQIAV